MSLLSPATKEALRRFVKRGTLLEIFPGNSGSSISFFHRLGLKIYTVDQEFVRFTRHTKTKAPPYPIFTVKFDYIFIQEVEFLWVAEHGIAKELKPIPLGATFINNHLRRRGLLILSKVSGLMANTIIRNMRNINPAFKPIYFGDGIAVIQKM